MLSRKWDRIVDEGDKFPGVVRSFLADSIFFVGGERWKKMRKISSAAVTKNTRAMVAPMAQNALALVEQLRAKAQDEGGSCTVEIAEIVRATQMKNVADIVFAGAFGGSGVDGANGSKIQC